jgi:hypothetical protein
MLPTTGVLNALNTPGVSTPRTSAVPLDSAAAFGAQHAVGNTRGNSLVEGMKPGGDQAAMVESVDPAKRNQQAIDALTKEAEKYGGFERIPGNSPVLRMAVESANASNRALARLAKSGAAADIDGPIKIAGGSEVGWYSLRQGARDAATAAGVIAGMFQSVGDGVIGAGALLKDVLLAQQYMLGGRDSAWSPNRLLPGFEMKREAYENVRALGQAVAEIAKDPGRFIGDTVGKSIDTVATRLETARDTDKLGDWFLYGASVGNVTVDVASVIAGGAGAARLATAGAREATSLMRTRIAEFSPDVRANPTAPELSRGSSIRVGDRLSLATTESVSISGDRAIDRAGIYEIGVRRLYGDVPFKQRQYEALVDGKWVDGVADNAVQMGGKNVAVEAKFVEDWSTSLRNPDSPVGQKPWALAEQQRMLEQASRYEAAFDRAVYHTNSVELATHYSRVFIDAGLRNFQFMITPATRLPR